MHRAGVWHIANIQNPDQALWRDIHLSLYDDPRASDSEPAQIYWKQRVQDRDVVKGIFAWEEDRYNELVRVGPSATHASGRTEDMTLG